MTKYILFIVAFLISVHSNAWDGSVSGKIHTVDVTGGNNHGFRISLDGGTVKFCGNDYNWAYLNETDSNYQAYVAVLLAAKMAEKIVTIYTNKAGDNEYCHIGYIGMR